MKKNVDGKLTSEDSPVTKIDLRQNTKSTQRTDDTEKTRIAQNTQKLDSQKTQPSKNNSTEVVDKTRFAPSKTKQVSADRTRIASNRNKIVAEATRVAPSATSKVQSEARSTTPTLTPLIDQHDGALSSHKKIVDDHSAQNMLKERFVLEKVLGSGGMGIVYKAKDLVKVGAGDKDPYLAVKVLGDEFKERPEAFIALQRESRKTQRIAHPNIVNVHDFDRDGDTVFMTMEYLEGKPLDQLIRQYKSTGLPTDEAQDILKSVCRALIYAHQEHIIHSDFKPGNIFVTDAGVTKVFDFGIARAVAKAEHYEDNPEDKTIFDAGDLGALTPAYASAEMLDGKEPDVRDDIYALGCVAYELFTGAHPFNKVPADEAKKQKLKPKRINNINRRQWKAIEKALAFDRADRIESVSDFLDLFSKTTSPLKYPIVLITSAVLIATVYFQFFMDVPQGISETEIRSELEFTLRLENYQNSVEELLILPQFTVPWEEGVWKQIQGVGKLLSTSEQWLAKTSNTGFKASLQTSSSWYVSVKERIYTLYLDKVRLEIKANNYSFAEKLIKNAYRYSENPDLLDEEKRLLASAMENANLLAEEQRKQRLLKEAENLKENELTQVTAKPKVLVKTPTPQELKYEEFTVAFNNVLTQLECQSYKLNMRNLDTAIQKLRSIDSNRYLKQENKIITDLVYCIKSIAKPFPERALELKKYALKLFNNNRTIVAVEIAPKDPCSSSLAGLGARGERATCKDSLLGLGTGPILVVIPGTKDIQSFALGKYEVSIAEYNIFCKSTVSCKEVITSNENLPISNISLKQAESYLLWLNDKTKQKYRLPSKNEWQYAANAQSISLDPNRNCQVNTRGISKGDKFGRVTVGRQNSWGLVNYVGNASEWVYDNGRKLVAVGGSYNIPLENCDLSSLIIHSGKADEFTGFRVLRELER